MKEIQKFATIKRMQKAILGKSEMVSILNIDIPLTNAKIDTGADSGALTAHKLKILLNDEGEQIAHFTYYPIADKKTISKKLKIKIHRWVSVKSSNGSREFRPRVKIKIKLGKKIKTVELTLSKRTDMTYPLILGKSFLKDWAIVDVSKEYQIKSYTLKEIYEIYDVKPRKRVRKKVRIAVLCGSTKLYSNQRMKEEAKNLGLSLDFILINNCFLTINNDIPRLIYKGENILNKYNGIIPRIRSSLTHFGTTLLQAFYNNNVYCFNTPDSIKNADDKFLTFQMLSSKLVKLPNTAIAQRSKYYDEMLDSVGQPPVIIKLLGSSHGSGVVLSESVSSAKSTLSALNKTSADFLVQEFIKESRGRDIRAFVIGNEVVASMQRINPNKDEFRSNIHKGGNGKEVKLTKEEKETAVRAAKLLGLEIAGIDMLRSNKGTLVLEVNSSPGLGGIEKATKVNIAKKIIEYTLSKIDKNN